MGKSLSSTNLQRFWVKLARRGSHTPPFHERDLVLVLGWCQCLVVLRRASHVIMSLCTSVYVSALNRLQAQQQWRTTSPLYKCCGFASLLQCMETFCLLHGPLLFWFYVHAEAQFFKWWLQSFSWSSLVMIILPPAPDVKGSTPTKCWCCSDTSFPGWELVLLLLKRE